MSHTRGSLAQKFVAEFKVHEYPYLSKLRPFRELFVNVWRLSRFLKTINPSLIHSFNYMSEYSEPLAAKLAFIPWVFTKKNMSWKGLAYNQWKVRSKLASDIIIQNSDMLVSFYPKRKNVHLIPRGVNASYFNTVENPEFKFAENVLNDKSKRRIVTVANLIPVKGIEDLIQAFAILQKNHANWQLWIVGDTNLDKDYSNNLKELSEIKGLRNDIIFFGKQEDVRPFLRASDIFVLPTRNIGRREGSPVALLEAMASGLIVLGSEVAGIKDQLKDFQERLFQPSMPEDLAQKMAPFLKNSIEQNKKLGEEMKQLSITRFSIQNEIQKHLDVYEKYV